MTILLLSALAFLAGLIDSMVGGGGLIQLPALLVFLPHVPHPVLFGINKFSACWGTGIAAYRYIRLVETPKGEMISAGIAAFLFAFLGAASAALMSPHVMRPLVLVLIGVVAIYTLQRKDFGGEHVPKYFGKKALLLAFLLGSTIGFYDGFFGPGTGSFLIFGFIGLFGFDFLRASASAKMVNLLTNIAALSYFIPTGNIDFQFALPMACCNILGSLVGTQLAVTKGAGFMRVVFLLVLSLLFCRLLYQTLIG